MDLSSYLKNKYDTEYAREFHNLLGYGLNRLAQLADYLDGIQPGLYIVGAETNIGKTALTINMFLSALQSNEHVKGIYFSFDDNKDVIINRLLSILTGFDINLVQFPQKLSPPLRSILSRVGYDALINLALSNRLEIYDMTTIDNFSAIQEIIEKNKNTPLIVCIDGICNLDLGTDSTGSAREDTIIRANKLKYLVDSYKIPVIATVEVRKKDTKANTSDGPTVNDIMETSKFGYNAHAVLMLHPENLQDFKEKPDPYLIISFEKNKLSAFKGKLRLKFIKAKGFLICENDEAHFSQLLNIINAAINAQHLNESYKY